MTKNREWEGYYTEDGTCAEVLVSPGYGAGWSTWNGHDIQLAADKRIIEFFKAHMTDGGHFDPVFDNNDLVEFFKSIDLYPEPDCLYFGGWWDCVIYRIPRNRPFRINEYDGYESIEFFDDESWITL